MSQAGGRGPGKGGRRPPERRKGRWWRFTAAVATFPGRWTVTSPRGLGGWTVSKRGSLSSSFGFFVLQRRAQAHEPAQDRASFCCGRCCRNSEQLMFHQLRSQLGGQEVRKPRPMPLTSGSSSEWHCGSPETF